MEVKDGYVRTRADDVTHYLDFGGHDRPIVVCLHGVTGHAWVWYGVAEGLSSRRRVVAMDLRGHGDSSWSTDGHYSTEDHVDDLEDLLTSVGAGKVDIVGSSWGALIGLDFLARHPSDVRSLAVVDMQPSFEQTETDIPPRPEAFETIDAAAAFERTLYPSAPESMLEIVTQKGVRHSGDQFVRKHDPYFLRRWPFRSDDRWLQLAAVRCPTLLVHAEKTFVSVEVMERMRDSLDHAQSVELVTIAESGHVVPVDAPAQLAELLTNFYAELDLAG